ncbi:MAG: type III-B CRISPR module-associated protein Cmr5 [Spirochaetota bacterium]|nr:type III-B CRISPR module-associated protein Cmr5 [Spirochaetota bacterium]
MTIITKQQQRAEFALKSLNKYKNGGVPKEYSQFIVGMPNMILSNGLGQSLAFLKAKSSKEERAFVFDILKKYLLQEYKLDFANVNDDFSFLEKLNSVSQSNYIKMQEEVLKLLEWLKRYARAFEKEDKKE